jgi:hypothetical protein
MKNIKTVLVIVLVAALVTGMLIDFNKDKNDSVAKELKRSEKEFMNYYLQDIQNKSRADHGITFSGGGTTSNFEGPQLTITSLKFFDTDFTREDGKQMIFFDGTTLNFDPDHPFFGLPNVVVKVSPVKLYEVEKSGLSELLRINKDDDRQKPYRVYRKAVITRDTSGRAREIEMQLWLTEFKVTVDILPERNKPPVTPTSSEENNIQYPAAWYGGEAGKVKLRELKEEWKNNRYGNLTLILKITPDNAPWYYRTETDENAKPAIGIGAVYCESLDIQREQDENRVSPNMQKGSVIFLYPSYTPHTDTVNAVRFSENLQRASEHIFENQTGTGSDENEFWNKPFYIRIFFNNIGSWKEGFAGNRKYDDQVTYSFIMPVFVIGSWDIIPPSGIIPEWTANKPFFREFRLKNLVPAWGLGAFGRFFSIMALVVVLIMVVPGVLPVFGTIIGKLFALFRK